MVIEKYARDPSTKRLAFYGKNAAAVVFEIGMRFVNDRVRRIV